MAPFLPPRTIITGIKEKIDALTVQADRLYLGTSTGNLYVYKINDSLDGAESSYQLVDTKKNLTRRSIEQLGYIKEINSLVVLSAEEASLVLFPLPTFTPATPLVKTKSAFSFAIYTSVQHITPEVSPSGADFSKIKSIPTLVTQLLVGCQRKAVLYTWRDGEAQGVKEASLPHSPRTIVFLNDDAACFAYPADYAIFNISTMTATDVSIPVPAVTASTSAMGALTGLTGYMKLGLGAKVKPGVVKITDSEVLVTKDNEGLYIGTSAKVSRTVSINWPAPPEEITFIKPYVLSVLPAGTVPSLESATTNSPQVPTSFIPTTAIQVRSSLSAKMNQTLPFPFVTPSAPTSATVSNATIRLSMSSPSAKSPVFFLTTPTDRSAAAAEGSSIWVLSMKPWTEQIDELVTAGRYADALSLLDTIDQAFLPDKDQRRIRIRALNAVSQFRDGKYDAAIDTFIELDFNPAKVVALYPESVAGRLSVPQENWISLYGGPSSQMSNDDSSSVASKDDCEKDKGTIQGKSAAELLDNMASGTGSIRERLQRTGLGALMSSAPKEDDTASISSKRKFVLHDDLHMSVETLVRYLGDRRPKLNAALAVVNITPESQSHKIAPLSETSVEELFALPNAPLSVLTPEQLLRFAQIVNTALYKSLLVVRPALLQSLCRIANWCEVSEVEEDLRLREKFSELKDLYHGKKMHGKALSLLRELGQKQTNMDDKLRDSISYLQKLGPEYLDQIFESSKWIFQEDRSMAFEIFTSEDVELPRQAVANYLEEIDSSLCARYLEFIIDERQEHDPAFHDRLVDLYLGMTLAAKKRNDEKLAHEAYHKLLNFVGSNNIYSVDRFFTRVSATELFEARAILLGRLGRHDQALELYVYRLHDYSKAEEYCKRVYQSGNETSGVFLTLLRIYLLPTVKTTSDLLSPALELISRHNSRLDPVETLQLLPPLVTAQDIRAFLIETLRVPAFDTRVVRQISKARNDQLARRLMVLQSRRVKVIDSRICPQCHKRLGNSVIAVHTPRGEVTHYQCRELFARRLIETTSY